MPCHFSGNGEECEKHYQGRKWAPGEATTGKYAIQYQFLAGVSVEVILCQPELALQKVHARAAEFYSEVANWMSQTSDAPVFHPTQEEWEKPMAFIRSIRPQAERYGRLSFATDELSPFRSVALAALSNQLPAHCRHLQDCPSNNLNCASFQGECHAPLTRKTERAFAFAASVSWPAALPGLA